MKRGGPLKRGKPLARGSGLARTGGLAPRSAARRKQMTEDRVPLIEALVEAGVGCEVCPMLASVGIETHCAGRIEGMHERRKSGAGGSRVNRANLVPACNWGNTAIEDYAGIVRDKLGHALVVRSGDPDWDALSKRRDKE